MSIERTKSIVNSYCIKTLKCFIYTSSAAIELLERPDHPKFATLVAEDHFGSLPISAALVAVNPLACYMTVMLEADSHLNFLIADPNVT